MQHHRLLDLDLDLNLDHEFELRKSAGRVQAERGWQVAPYEKALSPDGAFVRRATRGGQALLLGRWKSTVLQ
ncbi:MAG: hypothetical protein P8L46_01945 [Acidimicrobiales bacterium]|nr:hypothetical protein [Acidimicrobiales bacterium]MDG2216789.1 hypothetical protein [Acidimicrobiales bacterium]